MLRKLQGRPVWYQAWAVCVAVGASYVLVRVFAVDGLSRFDYGVMVFVHVSVLLDYVLWPRTEEARTEGAQPPRRDGHL